MKRIRFLAAGMAALLVTVASVAFAGSLTPPGTPGPTMKPLDQIEPRTAIKQSDLPLTIATPGSYYFTGNLTYSTSNANAIRVYGDNVTIDLNGFTLTGPGKAVGTSGSGIQSAAAANCSVRNGAITGFRIAGVDLLGDSAAITEVRSTDNGSIGIRVGAMSTVTKCVCTGNGGSGDAWGIYAADGCTIEGNTCDANAAGAGSYTGGGIFSLADCTISGNSCCYNAGYGAVGIFASGLGCQVRGNVCNQNVASGNGQCYGIEATGQTEITENTCSNNRCTAEGQSACGILAGDDCHVSANVCNWSRGGLAPATNGFAYGIYCSGVRCTVTANTCNSSTARGTGWGVGIRAGASSRVENNHCVHNIGAPPSNFGFGIVVAGNQGVVTSNTSLGNVYGAYFMPGTIRGYAAANLIESGTGIVDAGANNINGTTPSANFYF